MQILQSDKWNLYSYVSYNFQIQVEKAVRYIKKSELELAAGNLTSAFLSAQLVVSNSGINERGLKRVGALRYN